MILPCALTGSALLWWVVDRRYVTRACSALHRAALWGVFVCFFSVPSQSLCMGFTMEIICTMQMCEE